MVSFCGKLLGQPAPSVFFRPPQQWPGRFLRDIFRDLIKMSFLSPVWWPIGGLQFFANQTEWQTEGWRFVLGLLVTLVNSSQLGILWPGKDVSTKSRTYISLISDTLVRALSAAENRFIFIWIPCNPRKPPSKTRLTHWKPQQKPSRRSLWRLLDVRRRLDD